MKVLQLAVYPVDHHLFPAVCQPLPISNHLAIKSNIVLPKNGYKMRDNYGRINLNNYN